MRVLAIGNDVLNGTRDECEGRVELVRDIGEQDGLGAVQRVQLFDTTQIVTQCSRGSEVGRHLQPESVLEIVSTQSRIE